MIDGLSVTECGTHLAGDDRRFFRLPVSRTAATISVVPSLERWTVRRPNFCLICDMEKSPRASAGKAMLAASSRSRSRARIGRQPPKHSNPTDRASGY